MNRKAPNTAIIITILVVMAICVVCVCLFVTLIGAGYISAIKETPGYFSPRSTATLSLANSHVNRCTQRVQQIA